MECLICGREVDISAIYDFTVCRKCNGNMVEKSPKSDRDLIVNLAREVASLKQRLNEVERQSIANERDVRTFAEDLTEIKYRGGCV